MNLRALRLATAVAGLTTCIASAAFAGSVTYSMSVPLSSTNWSVITALQKFDPTLGCLTSICFKLEGHVEGDIRFESLDASPTTVTSTLAATMTLTRPDNSVLVTTLPVLSNSDDVTAYDGNTNFGGTSGRTYAGLTADKADSVCTTQATDFALFTGAGTIQLPLQAVGNTTSTGAGNLVFVFAEWASSTVSVTYNYDDCPTAAQPTTWGKIKGLYR